MGNTAGKFVSLAAFQLDCFLGALLVYLQLIGIDQELRCREASDPEDGRGASLRMV